MGRLLLVLVVAVASNCWAGITYTAVTRTILGSKTQAGSMRVRAWVDGRQARMDFIESALPEMESGTYLITSDGGDTAYLVDPRGKTYEHFNISGMIENMANLMRAMRSQMKVRFEEPKVEKLLDEPGPIMNGLPTRHYRYRTSYKSVIELAATQTVSTVTTEDIWTTTAIKEPGLIALLNKRPSSGDEQLDHIIQAEMEKVPGFPLKHVTSTRTETQNETNESRTEMRVVELRNVPIAPAMFRIPAGYVELDENDSDLANAMKKSGPQKKQE